MVKFKMAADSDSQNKVLCEQTCELTDDLNAFLDYG